MNFVYLISSIFIVCAHGEFLKRPLAVVQHEWNIMEYSFPSERARRQAEASGNLKAENSMLIDVQPYYFNRNYLRVFVTTPRFQDGVPYTLATLSRKMGANGPLLKPYPNYEAHDNKNGTNCDAITSAFRVAINECDQMWVIDSGSVGSNAVCAPQLLLFDLKTNRLVHRYRFDRTLFTPGASLFITPVVDVRDPPPRGSCSRTMVYVADVNRPGLVVYNLKEKKAWRVENVFMHPETDYGRQSVAGESFVLMDGIFGMATDKKNLYFHPFASVTEYSVPLSVLDNAKLFKTKKNNMPEAFKALGTRRAACAVSAMDSKHNLYCVTVDPIKLTVWNVNKPFDKRNVREVAINQKDFEFVSGMKVVRMERSRQEELWIVSNRYQKMAAGTRDFNEVNFRIVRIPLKFSFL